MSDFNDDDPPMGGMKSLKVPAPPDDDDEEMPDVPEEQNNEDSDQPDDNTDDDDDDDNIPLKVPFKNPLQEVDLPIDSPADPFADQRGDDQIVMPDADPAHSIYAFLNATAHPYRGPLRADVAAIIEDIYPTGAADPHGFYAALRQLDPQRQRYPHLDLFASAAASAPHERAVNALVHYWDPRSPVQPPPPGQPLDPLLATLPRMTWWYHWWLRVLYAPVIFPITQPLSVAASTQPLRRLARLTDVIQDLRAAEPALGRAALAHLQQHPPPPLTSWVDDFYEALPRAYAHLAAVFHRSGCGAAGLAAADAACRSMNAERRLCAQLLATEKLVERVLVRRHVEDMHLSRRVQAFRPDDLARMPFADAYGLRECVSRALETEVRQIQHVANRTAAYRFYRRVSCLRPWARLYLIVGDEADYAAAAAARNGNGNGGGGAGGATPAAAGAAPPPYYPHAMDVQTVRRVHQRLQAITLQGRYALNPFLLRPFALRDIPADKICPVCQDGFAPEQVLLQTTCNHEYHLRCIMGLWDDESTARFRCAFCRTAADAPGAAVNVTVPEDRVSAGEVRWLRHDYRQLLAWMAAHPDEALDAEQKAVRIAYWRRFTHNRDRRSIIGFGGRPYDWQPLPLFRAYEEEGLPTPPHPRYMYDVDQDRLVPEDPQAMVPMFRLRLRDNTNLPPPMDE